MEISMKDELVIRIGRRQTFKKRQRVDFDFSSGFDVVKAFGCDADGQIGTPLWDFGIDHYRYFIDNAKSREELIAGLYELSPFCDDALTVAEQLTEAEFISFKLALPHERRAATGEAGGSPMSPQFAPILFPENFFFALPIAQAGKVNLGTALIRLTEVGKISARL
jgi:hypothetical protein